jgi:hypothetical protein
MAFGGCLVVPNGVRRHVSELAATTLSDNRSRQMARRSKIANNREPNPVDRITRHWRPGVTGLYQINAPLCTALLSLAVIWHRPPLQKSALSVDRE